MAKPWQLLGLTLVLAGCGAPVVLVTPGFDPITLTGRAGGAVESGLCGYIGRRPDHRLQMTENMDDVKLQATGAGVVTVFVRGPDGVFCATPLQGQPAQISGYWQAGIYEVFIGSLDPNQAPPYRLLITGD